MALVWILYSRTANVRTSREMLMVESKRVSHKATMWGVSLYSASLPMSNLTKEASTLLVRCCPPTNVTFTSKMRQPCL